MCALFAITSVAACVNSCVIVVAVEDGVGANNRCGCGGLGIMGFNVSGGLKNVSVDGVVEYGNLGFGWG